MIKFIEHPLIIEKRLYQNIGSAIEHKTTVLLKDRAFSKATASLQQLYCFKTKFVFQAMFLFRSTFSGLIKIEASCLLKQSSFNRITLFFSVSDKNNFPKVISSLNEIKRDFFSLEKHLKKIFYLGAINDLTAKAKAVIKI